MEEAGEEETLDFEKIIFVTKNKNCNISVDFW
jgi:hypothetical protein